MSETHMWKRRTLSWALSVMTAIGIAGFPAAQAVDVAKMIYVDEEYIGCCAENVPVEAVTHRAAQALSGGAADAVTLTRVTWQTVVNPGVEILDESTLYAYLTEKKPLSVKYSKVEAAVEPLRFETVFVEDDTRFEDESCVTAAGENGEVRVTRRRT